MDKFYITCPWCTETSDFDADLSKVTVSSAAQMRDLLPQKDEAHGLFRCKTQGCVAPVEAVVVANPGIAEEIESHVLDSWTVPKLTRLQITLQGAPHSYLYSLLFNVSPVEQKRIHELSALMDRDLLSKAMLGFAVSKQVPIALFEGCTYKGQIVWMRVPAAGAFKKQYAFQYNLFCRECRAIFDKRVKEELAKDGLGSRCDPKDACPSCSRKNITSVEEIDLDRCAAALEIRKRVSLCHSSDLQTVSRVIDEFKKPEAQQRWPVRSTCWMGLTELAFPVVVHNHLAGVIMTGQLLSTGKMPTAKEVIDAERKWREGHADVAKECVLCEKEEFLSSILGKARPVAFTERADHSGEDAVFVSATDQDISDIGFLLSSDVVHISKVANDRYLQTKERTEGAFRAEISGTLLRNLLGAKEFPGFLKHILSRMKRFWAFERVCLLMGSDIEDELEVYATDSEYCASEERLLRVPYHFEDYEGATSSMTAPGQVLDEPRERIEASIDKKILKELPKLIGLKLSKQAFIVRVQRASRAYVFCFSGRDENLLSKLPRRAQKDGILLSPEARLQIETTCQKVAEDLHHFWLKYDQEQTSRALAHSLRGPVSVMFSPRGRFLRLLKCYADKVQPSYPDLYDNAQHFADAVKIGASMVDYELSRLTAATTVEDKLSKAKDDSTDLVALLYELKRRYEFMGRPDGKSWEGNESQFKEALVVGSEDMVSLAVQNVLDNAYKYSLNNKAIQVLLSLEEGAWVLKVKEFGVAIAPYELDRIGRKGYRGIYARRKKAVAAEGTGLGMFLVSRIMPAVGGLWSIHCTPPKTSGPDAEVAEVEVELRFVPAAKGDANAH